MNVYVGMDVHRKRSQIAVVDEAGDQERTATSPTIRSSWCRSLACWRRAPQWLRGRLRLGWLVELLEELELEPHLVHPSRCKAIAAARLQERQGRGGHAGPAAAGRSVARSLDRAPGHPGSADVAAPPGQPGAAVDLAEDRVHAVLADRGIGQDRGLWTGPGRAWLASLELPAMPRAIVQDCCGLLDALAPRSPGCSERSARSPSQIPGCRRSWSCPVSAG
jgi:transposase